MRTKLDQMGYFVEDDNNESCTQYTRVLWMVLRLNVAIFLYVKCY